MLTDQQKTHERDDRLASSAGVDILPAQFRDLERFVGYWGAATTNGRWERRQAASMGEIVAFYDATVPRAEEILEYLEQFEYDNIPDPCQGLVQLILALPHAALAVELHGETRPPNTPYPHKLQLSVGPKKF
ncbi:MAG: hypothetical protein AB7G25_03630 [Sphingomonadaceae bacterium]